MNVYFAGPLFTPYERGYMIGMFHALMRSFDAAHAALRRLRSA